MIPILFEKNQKIFDNQGLGPLKETTKCEVFEKKNGEFTLELSYPRNGKLFKKIKLRRLILAKPNGRDAPHAFRIFDIDLDSSNTEITVHATTITNDLGQNVVKLAEVFQSDAQGALDILKENLIYPTHFSLRSNIQLIKSTTWEHRNPLNAIVGEEGSIVHLWGGEIKRLNDTIWVYSRRGRDNVTMIRLEKNIKGLNINESFEDRYTSILPYSDWEEDQNEGENHTGEKIKRRTYGPIIYSRYHDPEVPVIRLVNFQPPDSEDPPYDTPEKINQVAHNYFTHKNPGADMPKYEVRANLLQLSESSMYDDRFKVLEQVNLWDTVDAYIPEWDINRELMITSITYDSLRERTISIEAHSLGKTGSSSLTDDMSKQYTDMSKKFKDMEQQLAEHKNGIFNIIMDSANGRNKIFSGRVEPPTEGSKEGDVWFKEVEEGKIEIWIFDGNKWIKKASEDIGEQLEREISNLRAEIETRTNASDVARQNAIDEIRRTAGLAKTIADQATIDAGNAEWMATNAAEQAAKAIRDAQTKSQQVLEDTIRLINDNKTTLQDQIRTVVETSDTKIDNVKGELTNYAKKTVVDGMRGTIDSQGRQITEAINLVSSKMDRTQVDSLISSKGYVTSNTVSSLIQQRENSILTEVSKVESKIPRNIGSVNILLNSDFSRTYNGDQFTVSGRTIGTYASEWDGYNPGVSNNHSTIYHAYLDNIFDRSNVYVFNESDGRKHWKGIYQDVTNRFVKLTEDKFTFSLDLYAKKDGLWLFGGFYYYDSNAVRNFHAEMYKIRPTMINKWHRTSVSVPFDRTKYNPNLPIIFYLYGYGWSDHDANSIIAVDKLQLEIGDVATAHHKSPEELESLVNGLTTRVEQNERGWQAVNTNVTNLQGTLATHTTTLANIDGTIRTQANRVVLEELDKTYVSGSIGQKIDRLITGKGYITQSQADLRASSIYDTKVVQTERGIETKITEMKTIINKNMQGRNYAIGTANLKTIVDNSYNTGNYEGSNRYSVHPLYTTYNNQTLGNLGFNVGDTYAIIFNISYSTSSSDRFGSYRVEGYSSTGYNHVIQRYGNQNPVTDMLYEFFGTFKITSANELNTNKWYIRFDNSSRTFHIKNFRVFKVPGPIVNGDVNHKDSPLKQPWQPAWEDFISETRFSETKDTVDMYRRVLGSTNENGVINKINELVMTNSGTLQTIADYTNMSDNLIVDSKWFRKRRVENAGLTSSELTRNEAYNYKAPNSSSPGYGYMNITRTDNKTDRWPGSIVPLYVEKMLRGETYTLSFYLYKGSNFRGIAALSVYNRQSNLSNGGSCRLDNLASGQYHHYTFTLTDDLAGLDNPETGGLYFFHNGTGTVEVKDVALRRGAKHLPYSPNPNDEHYIQTGIIKSEQQSTVTQVTSLAGSWAVRNLTSSGTVLNQLNLNKDGSVKIDGKLVQITGQTYIENGVITDAKISNLSVNKVTGIDASFLQARIGTLDVGKITGITSSFITSKIDSAIVNLLRGKTIIAQNGAMSIDLMNGHINFRSGGSMIFNDPDNYIAYASGKSVAFIQPTHRSGTTDAALALGVNGASSTSSRNYTIYDIDSNANGSFAGVKIFRSPGADRIDMLCDELYITSAFNSEGIFIDLTKIGSESWNLIDIMRTFNNNFKNLGQPYYPKI